MEQKDSLSAILRQDAQTAQNITEMYPADWNMDAVYRKAHRKFRERAAHIDTVSPPAVPQALPRRPKITLRASKWVTAACLMLTVGIAGGVAWMQMSVSEPPRQNSMDSVTTTVPIEEILPEQTALTDATPLPQTVTAVQSTATTLPTSVTQAETQTEHPTPSGATAVQQGSEETQSPDAVPQVSETQTVPQQTVTQQTATQQTAVQPTTTRLTTTRLTVTQQTTLSQTDDQNSAATTVRTTTTRPQSTMPQATTQTDENGASPPTDEDPKEDEPPSTGDSAPDAPWRLSIFESGEEFSVMYVFADQTLYPEPDFTVDLEEYTVSIDRTEYTSSNLIINEETDVKVMAMFSSGVSVQKLFKHSVYRYERVSLRMQEGDTSGYLLRGATNCCLIWFDGRYLCELIVKAEYEEELFRIAAAMITH